LHLKALTQAAGVEPSKNPLVSTAPSSAGLVLRLVRCRCALLALLLVVARLARLLPARLVHFGLGSHPSCFGRLPLLGRELLVRFEEHNRIRIAFLTVLRDWALVAFDDCYKDAACIEVETAVASEGVGLCMSERYALVCYSCNRLRPLCYEGVHFLPFAAMVEVDDF